MSKEKTSEIIIEYTKLIGEVIEGNYSDSEKTKKVVQVRNEIDRDLKKLKEIKHLLKVSLIKNLVELIEDV